MEVLDQTDELTAAVVESSLRHDVVRVGGWRKTSDAPLSEYLELQARRRSWRELPPNRRPPQEDF